MKYSAPPEGIKATARHILVKSTEDAKNVVDLLAGGASFATLAQQYSTCPSGAQGGSLGSFPPGTMVPEFDKVIFSSETNLGEVVGPIQTEVRTLGVGRRISSYCRLCAYGPLSIGALSLDIIS